MHMELQTVDPDQTAPLGTVWSGSALFAQTYLSENLGSVRYTLWPDKSNFDLLTRQIYWEMTYTILCIPYLF